MTKPLKMAPHTAAKHAILVEYLKAYYPILSNGGFKDANEILYVDGFAGPGRYEKGEEGSPVLAARTALGFTRPFKTPIRIITIEKDTDYHTTLCGELATLKTSMPTRADVHIDEPRRGACEPLLREIMSKARSEGRRFGPAFVFLDQFGWGDVSMDLVAEVMSLPACETFIYFNHEELVRFIKEKDRDASRDRAFGTDAWRKVFDLPPADWKDFLQATYVGELHKRKIRGVLPFYMYGQNGIMQYWLFYCTNSEKGMEVMKASMYKVDASGEFKFSDRDDPNQTTFLSNYDAQALAADLKREFSARISHERVGRNRSEVRRLLCGSSTTSDSRTSKDAPHG